MYKSCLIQFVENNYRKSIETIETLLSLANAVGQQVESCYCHLDLQIILQYQM